MPMGGDGCHDMIHPVCCFAYIKRGGAPHCMVCKRPLDPLWEVFHVAWGVAQKERDVDALGGGEPSGSWHRDALKWAKQVGGDLLAGVAYLLGSALNPDYAIGRVIIGLGVMSLILCIFVCGGGLAQHAMRHH